MPYQHKSDLPERVKDNLPSHAQDIYLKAFNNAWEEYADASKRRGSDSRETVAHKVAWSAVEESYHKSGDKWVANK